MKGVAAEGGWKGAAQATINQDLDLIKSCIEVTRDAARPRCGTERQRGMMRFLMLPPSCRSSAGFVFNDVATVARLRRRFYEQGLTGSCLLPFKGCLQLLRRNIQYISCVM